MKYYVIAGEASGDLHGSNLIKALKSKDTEAEIRAWGGDLMQNQGAILVKHISTLAFMGFTEVLMNIKTILSNISFCKADIEQWRPDCVIFIDYPGFNLRIAEHVKSLNIKTIYYISPQIWAWKENRVKKIKAYIDLMCVILPFEQAFYAKHNMKAHYVGHPLLDAIHNYEYTDKVTFLNQNKLSEKKIVAILPGSRKQEIKAMLATMLKATENKDVQVIIAGAPSAPEVWYAPFLNAHVKLIYNQTYNILKHADAALVTSGTATLETALHQTPQVVCYKANAISYRIAKKLIKIKYISLVNLIMDKLIVKELIQSEMQYQEIGKELEQLLNDAPYRLSMKASYQVLIDKLGNFGASSRTAELVYHFLLGKDKA